MKKSKKAKRLLERGIKRGFEMIPKFVAENPKPTSFAEEEALLLKFAEQIIGAPPHGKA